MLDPLCHLNRCYYTKTLNISYMIKTNPVELRLTFIFHLDYPYRYSDLYSNYQYQPLPLMHLSLHLQLVWHLSEVCR